jgi:cytochrome c-type biogenesis protein CcmF
MEGERMSIGSALIIIGTLTAFGAMAARMLSYRSKDKNLVNASVLLSVLTFASVTVTLLLLVYYFMSPDFSIYYVWSYSSSDLGALYKLSGVWAGAEGSFLLWIWFMALVLVVEVFIEPRRKYLGSNFHGIFQIVLAGIILVFMLILANMNLFRGTDAWLLSHYPDGYGMKLVLQTPEMVIHPPVVFAGYAFCVAALAAAVAYFLSEDRNWYAVAMPWARLSWIFLTLGIGIGAIWAYYVLGWGGYWSWDPVETSSLLPWLFVTAFLHTIVRHSRKGEYDIFAPLLGMLSFVAVIFATFATRAGGIWVSSVHAFGNSVGASASARLSYLLGHDSTVLGIFSLMLTLLALSLYLAYRKYSLSARPVGEPEPERLSEYISDRNNMLLTVLLFVVTSAIMLLLLFKNVNTSQSANYSEFNQKMSLFFVAIMVTLSVCLLWKSLGKERAFWFGIALIAVSVGLGIVAVAGNLTNGVVAFSLPSYVVAIGASVVKLARSKVAGSLRKTLQAASPHLIHLGVALVLMSYVVSSNLQSIPSQGQQGSVLVDLGHEVAVGDYTVRLTALDSRTESKTIGGVSVDQIMKGTVDILRGGKNLRTGIVLTDLYGRGIDGGLDVVNVDVYIYKAVLNDLYLDFQWHDNSSAYIQVKVIPLMNTLWVGLGLLTVGLAIRTVVWKQEPKESLPAEKSRSESVPRKPDEKPSGISAKPERDYEALVEEELLKFKQKKSG